MTDLGPVTCAGCGLLCDDVTIERSGDDRAPAASRAAWARSGSRRGFARCPARAPPATVGGQPADVDTALARAAELLRAARRPLLHGFDGATVEDARAAVALADRLGRARRHRRRGRRLAGRPGGRPARRLHRHAGRDPRSLAAGRHLARGSREHPSAAARSPRLRRHCRRGRAPSARSSSSTTVTPPPPGAPTSQLRWPAERDLEALSALHVLQRNLPLLDRDLAPELEGLLERLVAVPHAAFVYGGGLSAGAGGQRRVLALHELVRALSHDRHVVTLELPSAAGTAERGGRARLADRVCPDRGPRQPVIRSWSPTRGRWRPRGRRRLAVHRGRPGRAARRRHADRAGQPCRLTDAEVSIRTAPAGVARRRHRAPARRGPADAAGAAARRGADGGRSCWRGCCRRSDA